MSDSSRRRSLRRGNSSSSSSASRLSRFFSGGSRRRESVASDGNGGGGGSGLSQQQRRVVKLRATDPMLCALLDEVIDLEGMLLSLKADVLFFMNGITSACGGLSRLTKGIFKACTGDSALAKDTEKYYFAALGIFGEPSTSANTCALQRLQDYVENKVLGPLGVNLEVIANLANRMKERDARLASSRRKGGDPEETKALFEELSALHQHRYDFLRGPYQSLKKAQHAFFTECVAALEPSLGVAPRPATSADVKKAPPALVSPSATEMLSKIESSGKIINGNDDGQITDIDEEGDSDSDEEVARARRVLKARAKRRAAKKKSKQKRQPPSAEESIQIATPINSAFDPSLDAPSGGRAYSALGKAKGEASKGTRLTKDEPESELTKKAKALNLSSLKSSGSIKLSVKGFKSSSSSSSLRRRESSSKISLCVPNADEIPMKIAPMPDASGEIPMKIAPMPDANGEIPMKIAPMPDASGEIPMKIAPMPDASGEIPMKIAPMPDASGEIPMKIAPMPLTEGSIPRSSPKVNGKKKKRKKSKMKKKKGVSSKDSSSSPSNTTTLDGEKEDAGLPSSPPLVAVPRHHKSLSETLGLDDFSPVILDED